MIDSSNGSLTIQARLSYLTTVLFVVLALLGTHANAQSLNSGRIDGVARDETGAALPGVRLTLTSPALQVAQLFTTTDAEGQYRFDDLNIGVYRLQAELDGFQTVVLDGLQVSAAFAARVNVAMKIGSLNETVTVSGQSPVVDLSSTRGGRTLDIPLLQAALPMTGNYADIAKLIPGVNAAVVMGSRQGNATEMGNRGGAGNPSSFGIGEATTIIEGYETQNSSNQQMSVDAAELDVKTYGNTADLGKAGTAVTYVFPSGGNSFHGVAGAKYMGDALQSANITAKDASNPRLVQLFRSPEEIKDFADAHANLGGRIVKDKLWFFVSNRTRYRKFSTGGFVGGPGPDGQYLTGDEPVALLKGSGHSEVFKVSYQMSQAYQLVGVYWRDSVFDNPSVPSAGIFGTGSALTVPFENSSQYRLNFRAPIVQFRGTPTNKLSFDIKVGRSGYKAPYLIQPGYELLPSAYDRATQLYTGSSISPGITPPNNASVINAERKGITDLKQVQSALTFVHGGGIGDHVLKAGFRAGYATTGGDAPNHRAGNYMLVFDTVNGVKHQPVEIVTFSLPVSARNNLNLYYGYLADQWRVNDRLTLNLGLRWERQTSFVPEQTQEASTFVKAATYPKLDVGAFNTWAPRTGIAWDLTGHGKSVVKATYGWFNIELLSSVQSVSDVYNPVKPVLTNYRWHDLNGNGNYDAGEVDLSRTGADFISATSTSAQEPLSNNFKIPHQHEVSTSFEQEIGAGASFRALYVYRREVSQYSNINVGLPYSAYNIPLQRRDPGPDGVINTADDGGMFTIYDYAPEYRGVVSLNLVNRPSNRADSVHTLDFGITQRATSRLSLGLGYSPAKNHKYLVGIITNPNDEYNQIDNTWSHTFRANGNYLLPWDVQAGGTLLVLSGRPGQRTNVFRAADPLGGPALRQLSTVTVRVEPYGDRQGPTQPYLDLRVGKKLALGQRSLLVSLDALNALNTSAAQLTTYASGPTFDFVTQIPNPRIFRIGLEFRF